MWHRHRRRPTAPRIARRPNACRDPQPLQHRTQPTPRLRHPIHHHRRRAGPGRETTPPLPQSPGRTLLLAQRRETPPTLRHDPSEQPARVPPTHAPGVLRRRRELQAVRLAHPHQSPSRRLPMQLHQPIGVDQILRPDVFEPRRGLRFGRREARPLRHRSGRFHGLRGSVSGCSHPPILEPSRPAGGGVLVFLHSR